MSDSGGQFISLAQSIVASHTINVDVEIYNVSVPIAEALKRLSTAPNLKKVQLCELRIQKPGARVSCAT